MKAYPDTSFLVSLYTPDVHSASAAGQMSRTEIIWFLTPFGEVELTNALQLRLFRKEPETAEVNAAYAAFQKDVATGVFSFQPMPAAAFEKAGQLARKHTPKLGVRTLDILHVASALVLGAEAFYTFDFAQAKLAKAVGLATPRGTS